MRDDKHTHHAPRRRSRSRQPVPRTRVGKAGGRAVRSFHCALGAIRVAPGDAGRRTADRGIGKALDGVDYIDRAGTYGDRAHALEATGGSDRDELAAALEEVDRTALWRNGRTAEKVALTLVVEMPADSTTAQRRAAAGAIAALFGEGGPVGWALHRPPSENDNWHLHLIRPARPVIGGPDGWTVERDNNGCRRPPAFRKPYQKKALRVAAAEAVNGTCAPAVEYHPGTLREIGIDRAGRKRLPRWAWPLRDREDAEAAMRAAAPSPLQADQAVYVYRWNAALDRGEDPTRDAFVAQRRQILVQGVAERRAQRAAAAAARQAERDRLLVQATEPLVKAARATDRRRIRQVIDAGRSYRDDYDAEMRRADAATRQAREATAALAQERNIKAAEIAAAELRALTDGERRFLTDRLAKHLSPDDRLRTIDVADVDLTARRLAFRLAKAREDEAKAAELVKRLAERDAELAAERSTKQFELTKAQVAGISEADRWFLRNRVARHMPFELARDLLDAAGSDPHVAGRRLAERLVQGHEAVVLAERLRQELAATQAEAAAARSEAARATVGLNSLAGLATRLLRGAASAPDPVPPPADPPARPPGRGGGRGSR